METNFETIAILIFFVFVIFVVYALYKIERLYVKAGKSSDEIQDEDFQEGKQSKVINIKSAKKSADEICTMREQANKFFMLSEDALAKSQYRKYIVLRARAIAISEEIEKKAS